MDITEECGAVKAHHVPIVWVARDRAAALELHSLLKHFAHNLITLNETIEKIGALNKSGALLAFNRHYPILMDERDMARLSILVLTSYGELQ